MSVENWEHFFKPEVRSSGQSLFTQGKVSLSQPSDTEIVAFIRISSPLKVSLKSKSVSSATVYADCNCPAGKKDLFCKHIWAALLATEAKTPEFFEDKTEIEKMSSTAFTAPTAKAKPTAQASAYEEKQAAYKAQQKEKQALYRKIQYQKQKLRVNTLKMNKKGVPVQPEFPSDIEKALSFFSQNGFELRESMNKEIVASAKKKLARIFHPDRGGTHEEILELNSNSDILTKFISKLSETES